MMNKIGDLHKQPFFWVFLDQAVFSGYSFLLTIVAAHFLGVEIFGIFASLFVAIYFVISINSAIVVMPFQVLLPSIDDKRAYFSFLFCLLLLVIIILLSLGYLINELSWNPYRIPESLFRNFAYNS